MAEYYPEDDETPAPAEGGEEEGASEGATALLPKSILGGKEFEVGDEVVLKIVRKYDDEIEVEYATGESAEGEKGMMPANEELDMMDSGGMPKGGMASAMRY